MRYSLKLRRLVQHFVVLGKSIFLHFPSIWNQFIEIVSRRIIFNQLNCVNKKLDFNGFLYYKSTNVIIISNFCSRDVLLSAQVSFPSLTSPLKSHHCTTFLQYLGKYVFVRRETRFGKVAWGSNPTLLNKFSLKIACAYLNTQESSPSGTPLKRLQDGNVFYIILRYLMNLRSLVQYLFVLDKFIFLDFPYIWNEFIETFSTDVLSSAQVSLPSLSSPLKSYYCTTFLQYLGKYVFVRRETSKAIASAVFAIFEMYKLEGTGKFHGKLTRTC
ncbi:hypothetical protein T03_13166 [Trichinella britovi]|uniref:Uncharacterized protein n=1 Tax=Trichinella britovi TaxID=45882 RepID=A0A0V1CKW1_TRIBR|nr:hypothetical protein T03_13166 [Trichinella britovi]